MKCRLFIFAIFLMMSQLAWAHDQGPITDYFPSAENVYLVQVASVDVNKVSFGNKVTFTVEEVLRGNPVPTLILAARTTENYTPKSEWLLVSCTPHGWGKDSAGWVNKGDCAWIPGSVFRHDNTIYVKDWTSNIPGGPPPSFNGGIVMDSLPDGKKGLTLDHVKRLLNEKTTKH